MKATLGLFAGLSYISCAAALSVVGPSRLPTTPSLTNLCSKTISSSLLFSTAIETEEGESFPGVEYLPTIREEISEHLDEWDKCVDLIVEATQQGMSRAEAELRLAEATRWKAWAIVTSEMARKYLKTVLPTADALKESLEWLQSESGPLKLSPEQLQLAFREYPETYLQGPAQNYKKALNVAPREWRDHPEDFNQLVRDQPRAMSLTYNCVDDGCAANCGSCWVTFRNSS